MIIGMMPFSYECLNTSDASCTLKFRGMGDSSYRSDDEITIEVLSRDLLFLIESYDGKTCQSVDSPWAVGCRAVPSALC